MGLQHQAGLSVFGCCLFACAQGFIKPISKKNVKILVFIECTKACVPMPRQNNKLHHASWHNGGISLNAGGNVKQVFLRQRQALRLFDYFTM